MKIWNVTAVLAIISLISCDKKEKMSGVRIHDDPDVYRFETHFDPVKTRDIERLINKRIAPTNFELDEDVNVTAILEDRTKFHFESSLGELEIELDKNENHRDSYYRIKALCSDIRSIVDGKKVK